MNLRPFIEKALKCPQHSIQVSLRKVSSLLRREFAGTSIYIQYSCRKYPLTRIVNNLVGIGTGNPEGF
jgi:chaperone required for assembly of F1-ATPase